MDCFKMLDDKTASSEPTDEWKAIKVGDKIKVRTWYFISATNGKPYIQLETGLGSQECQLPHELKKAKPNSIIYISMIVQDKIRNAVFAKLDLDQPPTFNILACNIIEKVKEA